jgi:Na+-transporting NADH:ubiquinone oxidoreductase subunit NqrE
VKILGREPVYLLAFVAIALKLASAYGLGVSDDQQTAIMAVLSCIVALATAIVLKTGAAAAAIVNLAQAGLALFLGFGLDMSAEQQALWMLLVEGAVAIFLRKEVTAPVPAVSLETSSPLAKQHGPTSV